MKAPGTPCPVQSATVKNNCFSVSADPVKITADNISGFKDYKMIREE